MRLGIDLGTTRTVVARADRGNYPVLTFLDPDGDVVEHLPSIVALVGGRLVHGFDAVVAERDGAPTLRSFKRVLGDPGTGLHTGIDIGGRTVPLLDLLTDHLRTLRREILAALDQEGESDTRLEAVVSVPAHAHTTQRFLTLEAFRAAGFEVVGLVNEPSAAGFEFTHRQTRALSSRRTQVLVYDLGGGTFDASLVQAQGRRHEVLGSVGVNRLGGDDFDVALAETVLDAVEADDGARPTLTRATWRRLLEDCREAKERLAPQSRRLVVELEGRDVVVAVDAFYDRAAPLVARSVDAMEPLVGRLDDSGAGDSLAAVAGMYLVGGASGLPLVSRLLRERFGRRVHRAPYPAAATAIGLAIAADPDSGVSLRDRLSRGFGVYREADGGTSLAFDELLGPDVALPQDGTLVLTRRYRPAHDLGVFRFVEYAGTDGAGRPAGEIVPVAQVRFPFTPQLQQEAASSGAAGSAALESREVRALAAHESVGEVEERYTVTADGAVTWTITDTSTGFALTAQR